MPAADGERETRYQLVLPKSRVVLTYGVPRAYPDFVTVQFLNPDGVVVDSWTVEEPDWGGEDDPKPPSVADPDGNWEAAAGLFRAVHNRATGWDEVIRDIETAVASPEPIGATSFPQTAKPGVAAVRLTAQGPTVARHSP
jgi:hypothetical protein